MHGSVPAPLVGLGGDCGRVHEGIGRSRQTGSPATNLRENRQHSRETERENQRSAKDRNKISEPSVGIRSIPQRLWRIAEVDRNTGIRDSGFVDRLGDRRCASNLTRGNFRRVKPPPVVALDPNATLPTLPTLSGNMIEVMTSPRAFKDGIDTFELCRSWRDD